MCVRACDVPKMSFEVVRWIPTRAGALRCARTSPVHKVREPEGEGEGGGGGGVVWSPE